MKKVVALLLLTALLAGCKAEETFEVVEDEIPPEPVVSPQQFFVSLPEDAAVPTFQDESGELYVCQDYTVSKQILDSGDLEKTVQTVSGHSQAELQVIKTVHAQYDRYDFVWAAAAEEGMQVGRACILDDGNYHYVLSVQSAEEANGQLQKTIQDVFSSCKLLDPEVNLHTGS